MTDEIERIRRAYDQRDKSGVTKAFSYENPEFAFHMQEREWAILKAFRDSEFTLAESRILEVGCGTGHVLQRFVAFGAGEACGIELMENRVEIAKRLYPELNIQAGNAAALPYGGGVFDIVTQFMCISSVLDKDVRLKIAQEMWRVLRPGGIFLSYDLRPPSLVAEFSRAVLRKLLPGTVKIMIRRFRGHRGQAVHVTPIEPLGLEEIRSWHLAGHMNIYRVSLHLKWTKIACRSRLLAELLALLPWFRSSYLIMIRKPSSGKGAVHD